jgi:hypothetical protein
VSFLAVVHCLRPLSLVAVDLIRLVALAARPRAALVAENLFSAKAVGLLPGAEGQASTGRRCHSLDDGGSESMVRLAERAGECPSGHAPALASDASLNSGFFVPEPDSVECHDPD